MMRKYFFKSLFATVLAAGIFTSCNDDNGSDVEPPANITEAYVMVASNTEGQDIGSWLLSTDNITSGNVSSVGAGTESDNATQWVYFDNKYLYGFIYRQGSPAMAYSYTLNSNGRLVRRSNSNEIQRYTTYGTYNNNIITTSTGPLGSEHAVNGLLPEGFLFSYLNVETQVYSTNTEVLMAENYLGNGEYVTLAGFLQVGNKIYTAPIPMGLSVYGVQANNGEYVIYPELVKDEPGGSGSGAYEAGELQWTQYPDEAYIAIYDDATFTTKKLLKTDKISYAAGRNRSQYYQMIWPDDQGNIYVFSPSYAKTMEANEQKTTLPAGVVRINAGTEEFDPNYYYNLEEKANGRSFMRTWHITGDYFLMLMYDRPLTEENFTANQFAIFKGSTGELKTVTAGMPAPEEVTGVGSTPYVEDGQVYIPIVTVSGPAIYQINPVTATATRGATTDLQTIAAIGKLKVVNN